MFKEFSNNDKDDDYLSEFRQKIATQNRQDMEERRHELQRSRNGFIGTLAGIGLAVVVSWFLLIPRFSNNESVEIAVIRRPITPVKIQPNEPGGMEILNQDKSVYNLVEKKQAEPTEIESLLPPPEAPKMPVIVPEPEPLPLTGVSENGNPDSMEELISTAAQTDIESEADPIPTKAADAKNTLPTKVLHENIEPVASTLGQQIEIPKKIAEIKVEAKTAEVKNTPNSLPNSEIKSETKENAPAAKAAAAEKTGVKANPVTAGMWQVQLMASTNKGALEKGWHDLSSKYPALKPHQHEIESAKTGAGAQIYRLKAGAFNSRADADSLCAALKNAGGTCIVKQK